MPSRASLRNGNLPAYDDVGHGLEPRTFQSSKQYQKSRFAKEKPTSPRAGQSLKFKDKVKAENPIRPPYADVPLEFVKNGSSGFVVQTKSSRNEHRPQTRKSMNQEDELIKYMSKVPGYLQRGDKLQDNNVLNFGVLDWGRLEKWTHNQNKVSGSERTDRRATASCSTSINGSSGASVRENTEALARQREQPKVDCSPVVKPLNGKEISSNPASSFNRSSDEKKEIHKKDKLKSRDSVVSKSAKGKEKCSVPGSSSAKLSKHGHRVIDSSKMKISAGEGRPDKPAENLTESGSDQRFSGKQEGIVLLLPKDFSKEGSSEVPSRVSLDGKSAELNWGSFSDIFSIDETQLDEPDSGFQHACHLPETETETELDLTLDNLIKAQGVELPVNQPDMPFYSIQDTMNVETSNATIPKAIMGLDQRTPSFSAELTSDSSTPQRFGFSLARMTRSLSFKEGSEHPQLKPSYVSVKSGPANANGRTRESPFRRLLDPLLKNKAGSQLKRHLNDLRSKPSIDVDIPEKARSEPSTMKAFLYLSIKSGLPLFKFVVETRNEILASTVKSLSPFGKNDSRWLYTFYSVHQLRKKSRGWKNHKDKTCGFSYDIIGQMKVSNPHVPSWCEKKSQDQEHYMVKESVLYCVDLSKAETTTSELMTSRELAAIVVKMPNDTSNVPSGRFSNFEEDEILGNTVVILPGGIHSLPNEGVPSPLINRWRSGGECDCGGWDVGCKLRILTNQVQDHKTLSNSKPPPTKVRCDLFEQGEARQRGPLFTLVPFRDGLFSLEFDAEISSLQAFSICVAIINSHSSYPTNEDINLNQEFDREKAPMVLPSEGLEKLISHPPLSPVGRV